LLGSIKTEFSLNWLFGPSIGIVARLDDSFFLDKRSITSTSERDNFKIKLLGRQTSLQTKIEIFAIKDKGFQFQTLEIFQELASRILYEGRWLNPPN
jgi:hypothetical protein